MSPSLDSAQLQWLAQLASMRQAIAELKLPQTNGNVHEYGHDIVLDDDELTNGSDVIWDLNSEEDGDEYSSDFIDGHKESIPNGDANSSAFNQAWLKAKCTTYSARRSGFDQNELQGQIVALLASDSKGRLIFYLFDSTRY